MPEERSRGWGVAIHGGAGAIPADIPPARREACIISLTAILEHGAQLLSRGSHALDVVEELVIRLENEPLFNAGRGAVFTSAGEHELEAAIMDGSTLDCGAVAGIRTVRNPIRLARCVMQQTKHIMLAGAGAEEYAESIGLERVEPSWFDTDHRRAELERYTEAPALLEQEGSTVGAVVRDSAGRLAAATSTGGMTGKMPGRIGDTPLVGCGTYADGGCAVSCTGHGESFVRHVAAHEVAVLARSSGRGAEGAVEQVLEAMPDSVGGIIAIDRESAPVALFSSRGMYRGRADSTGLFETLIHGEA
ncbi:MAG: beta-aspartyl-peptidase [Phycisphaerae bacterium]|nr:beta-aspartyl-peptidase [Phycisphaerae bacterium]